MKELFRKNPLVAILIAVVVIWFAIKIIATLIHALVVLAIASVVIILGYRLLSDKSSSNQKDKLW